MRRGAAHSRPVLSTPLSLGALNGSQQNAPLSGCPSPPFAHPLRPHPLSPLNPQTVTMYKSAEGFEAKEFAFKLQSVVKGKGDDNRKTFAKTHIDLAEFCTGQPDPQPVEKTLTLK